MLKLTYRNDMFIIHLRRWGKKMKNILETRFLFKECKKCPVKTNNQERSQIINPCQNCIEAGRAMPPPIIQVVYKN